MNLEKSLLRCVLGQNSAAREPPQELEKLLAVPVNQDLESAGFTRDMLSQQVVVRGQNF